MKIYIVAVSFFLILLLAAAVVLWRFLAAYENTRPKHVAEKVFGNYFLSSNVGELASSYTPELMTFHTVEAVNKGFEKSYDTERLGFTSVSSEGKTEKYAVSFDNHRIAYFTLKEGDRSGGFGFKYYELANVEFFFGEPKAFTALLPKGCTLSVNGVTVSESYITEADIEDASCKYMPEGVEGKHYDKYSVSGLLFEPEVTVKDGDGKLIETAYDAEEKCYTVPTVYSERLKSEHSDFAISAASAYTAYLSNDASFSNVAGYLDRSSEIYKRIQSVTVTWVRDHSGYTIYDQNTTEFCEYADGVFSCRVTLKERLTRHLYEDYIENVDLTLYIRQIGTKYYIYEIVNN